MAAGTLALASAGCATARLASGWASGPVTADGNAEDWIIQQPGSTVEHGLQLTVANDAERLYVIAKFRANDPRWSRAARAGMTVRLVDSRRRMMSFRLPEGPERGRPGQRPGMSSDSAPELARMPERWLQAQAELMGKLVVIDFDKVEIPVPADGSLGPAAAFSGDNAICVYEFSIPLNDTAFGHYSVATRPGGDLRIAVTAGLTENERRAMREQMGTQGPSGRGEMPSGSGHGGPPGGGSGGPDRRGGLGRGGSPRGQVVENPLVSVTVRLAVGP